MMKDYSKHKECSPADTVLEIRRILHSAGLFPVLTWGDQDYPGARSNRITLYPTIIGQNGKGTDELYASASGFAELMERMQNSWLAQKLHPEELDQYGGFREFPDEKIMRITDVITQEDPYMEDIFRQLDFTDYWQKYAMLRQLARLYYHRTDECIPAVPYVDILGDKIVYIPFAVITLFGISNGMTAGNTLEEALVQGFSELYERHVHKLLLQGGITPPEVPREVLQQYSIYKLIEDVEKTGRFRVSVRDCSLGKGFPVSMVIVADLERGTFGAKPGCHPSFAISVERTLTEALQGRKMEVFAGMNHVASPEELQDYHNIPNILKTGPGGYPPELLTGTPSWEYRPWSAWEGLDNHTYLSRLMHLAREMGYRPLIRDSSHMGFPSYHLLIPGIHSIYPVDQTRLREFWTMLRCGQSLNHFPDLTREEEKRLMDLILFKENSVESGLYLPLMHYYRGSLMTTERIGAYLALKLERHTDANRLFLALARKEPDPKEQRFLCALADYARFRSFGLTREEALDKTSFLCTELLFQRIQDLLCDQEHLLQRVFPQVHCFDCSSCPLAGSECEFPAAAENHKKIKSAMAGSKVDQERFREELKALGVFSS